VKHQINNLENGKVGDQILKVACRLPAEEAVSIYFDLNLGKMA